MGFVFFMNLWLDLVNLNFAGIVFHITNHKITFLNLFKLANGDTPFSFVLRISIKTAESCKSEQFGLSCVFCSLC